ncbi:hypothetical protein Tco_0692541 [Tanacetum coccineum]
MIARGASNRAKRDLRNLQTTQASLERPHEIDAPHVKDLANLDGNLRHFITLRSFSLTLARVTIFNQLVCIFVNSGPKETGIKDLFGGDICSLMSPGGSIMESFEKCLSDEPLAISLDEIHIDDKLHFVEEPVEIMDCEVKRLKQSRITMIKVRWNSERGPEFAWECEDQF